MPEAESVRDIDALDWLSIACGDLLGARAMLDDSDVPPRHAAFLAQQAAEKALKAALVVAGKDIPRTHDLGFLASRLPDGWRTQAFADDMPELTAHVSGARYPDSGRFPEADDAASAVRLARLVYDSVVADLSAQGVDTTALPCR